MLQALGKKVRPFLRRRFVLATVVGGMVFASVYAFAATLGVSSQSLGAGNVAVATCTAATKATYTIAYDGAAGYYKVSQVKLDQLLTACSGLTITVNLTGPGASNASLTQVNYTVLPGDTAASPGGQATIPVVASINAANVSGIAVAIAGG